MYIERKYKEQQGRVERGHTKRSHEKEDLQTGWDNINNHEMCTFQNKKKLRGFFCIFV